MPFNTHVSTSVCTGRHRLDGLGRFFASETKISSPALCPEIKLHVAADLDALWRQQEAWLDRSGLPPPYWGVAWPGGLALARYVLDNPDTVRGRRVLDVGSGSGICAIAAALVGGQVLAADIDPAACAAIMFNAQLNSVRVSTTSTDPVCDDRPWDVILAADLWYERFMARRLTGWLQSVADAGVDVFLGDLGRAYFPRQAAIERGCFRIEHAGSREQEVTCDARAWQLPAVSRPTPRVA